MDTLWTIGIILVVLWLLGVVTSYTLGGFIHILLVLALIVVLVRIIQGRSPSLRMYKGMLYGSSSASQQLEVSIDGLVSFEGGWE